MRIKHVRALQSEGKLDSNLRWVPASVASLRANRGYLGERIANHMSHL